jgi:hypothetical protein
MKTILLSLLAALLASAQPTPTTIVGPVVDGFGNPYTGSFVVQSQAKTNTGWVVTGTVRTVYVNAGVIGALALIPNDTSVPNLTSYAVRFANNDQWFCIVPTSSTPVAFTAACSPGGQPPNVGQSFPVSQLIPCPNGLFVGAAGGITQCLPLGLSYYAQAVTGSTRTVVPASTHLLLGTNLIVTCTGLAECGQVNVSSTGTVTVTSLVPWTGTLYIVTGTRNYNLPFTSATTASVLWPLHGLSSLTAAACYDSSGNQFGTGDVTIPEHSLGIGGLFPNAFDVSITLSVSIPQTGRCVLIGT